VRNGLRDKIVLAADAAPRTWAVFEARPKSRPPISVAHHRGVDEARIEARAPALGILLAIEAGW